MAQFVNQTAERQREHVEVELLQHHDFSNRSVHRLDVVENGMDDQYFVSSITVPVFQVM